MEYIMAERKNLEIYRGDSKTITVNFSSAASMLDGGTVWLTLKEKKDELNCDDENNTCVYQTSDLVEPILENGEVVGYKAQIYMSPADTGDFDIRSYVYDVQVVSTDEDPLNPGTPLIVKTLIEGKFKVLLDVTRKT
jgi:hypothetical protein